MLLYQPHKLYCAPRKIQVSPPTHIRAAGSRLFALLALVYIVRTHFGVFSVEEIVHP